MDINSLLRDNIKRLKPYSSARGEFSGKAEIYIDANENPFELPYNRYPDPLQKDLKLKLAAVKGVNTENIFLGNGSDEAIDIVIRAFCVPGKDSIIATNPSYGMYKVSADINDIRLIQVPTNADFTLDFDLFKSLVEVNTKIAFFCSPNNPSGNSLPVNKILEFTAAFNGIVVVDEAYIDFSNQESLRYYINDYKNLVVMQTFSKAWGSAAIRVGMAFADVEIIQVFNRVKPPYNVSQPAQLEAIKALDNLDNLMDQVSTIVSERKRMELELTRYRGVKEIFPSEANFVLVRVDDANKLYKYLTSKGIVVRNRHGQMHCDNCLRITVGTPTENDILYITLNEYYNEKDFVFG